VVKLIAKFVVHVDRPEFPGEFERQEEPLGCGSDAAAYGIVWIVEKKLREYRDR
jgi:hypothetical protein